MTQIRQKALLVGAVSLLGVTGAIAMSGPASAQSGSRICGAEFSAGASGTTPEEVLLKIYEVPENRSDICDFAVTRGGSSKEPMDAPQGLKDKMRHEKSNAVWPRTPGGDYTDEECERFTANVLGNDFQLVGTNFPAAAPHTANICLDMNRSDGIADMQAYWLLRTQVTNEGGKTETQWFLQRG